MMVAGTIGERNVFERDGLVQAETFLIESLTGAGYRVAKQEFRVELEQHSRAHDVPNSGECRAECLRKLPPSRPRLVQNLAITSTAIVTSYTSTT